MDLFAGSRVQSLDITQKKKKTKKTKHTLPRKVRVPSNNLALSQKHLEDV